MTIRKLQSRDIHTILRIETEIFAIPFTKLQLKFLLQKYPSDYCYVVEQESLIVGYLITGYEGEQLHIITIGVAKEWQHRGWASTLLQTLLHDTTEDIYLEVRESNTIAIHLYLRHDFVQVGRTEKYYPDGETALNFVHQRTL